jgi:hypothetical protein
MDGGANLGPVSTRQASVLMSNTAATERKNALLIIFTSIYRNNNS